MEDESSPLASNGQNMDVVRSKAIPKRSATTTAPETMETIEPSHKQPVKTLTDAQNMTRGGQLGPTSNVTIKEVTKAQEPPPAMSTVASPLDNVYMVDVLENEVVDYEGFGGEEPTKLSSEDDDAWDLATDTALAQDSSKFSYL